MTANEIILNGAIRHSVWTERYKTSVSNRILALLNKADADLAEKLAARLLKIEERGFDIGRDTTKRLAKLQAEIREARDEVYKLMYGTAQAELFDFADYEADFQSRLIEGVVSVELARPSASQMRAVVTSQPFQGRLLREWFSGLSETQAQRINDTVKIGITEGQTTDQIVRAVKGTRANNYRDGILEIDRRNAAAIARTAIQHVSDRAGASVWDANADIVMGVQWVSTLDSRTSAICRSRDGKIYKLDKAPAIPAHFGCRSRKVPYLGQTSIKGTRASAIGPVPEDVSYGDWLRAQPVAVQEEVLGKAKAKLFRKGGLSIDRFQDNAGREYTLDELKERDLAIWNRTFSN